MSLYFEQGGVRIYQGHVLDVLAGLKDESVNCVVTSPPYLWKRDYGLDPVVWGGRHDCEHEWRETMQPCGCGTGESFRRDRKAGMSRGGLQPGFCDECGAWCGCLGLEPSPELFVEHIVMIFREVWRVLRSDGTVWLNLGDSYVTRPNGPNVENTEINHALYRMENGLRKNGAPAGLKHKDLVGVPWRCALALQADGWWLRHDIIWHKPNPMPESAEDRPTGAHEYVFLLSKSERYFYDAEAIKEPAKGDHSRNVDCTYQAPGQPEHKGLRKNSIKVPSNWKTGSGDHGGLIKESSRRRKGNEIGVKPRFGLVKAKTKNKRSVWTIPTAAFSGDHFSSFPEKLVEPCIRAGCPEGGVVLDPFCGSGTVGIVAMKHGCRFVGIDQGEKNCEMAVKRIFGQGYFDFGMVSGEGLQTT